MDKLISGISEFVKSNNQRASIIFACSMLEQFISDLIKVECKHSKSYNNFSLFQKVNLLHELNKITDAEYESINWLRLQRNSAAHTTDYTAKYDDIPIKWIMPQLLKDTDPLTAYLITTVGGFWNNHPKIRDFY